MAWKLAPAVKAMFTSANAIGPHRNKASDGTIGDPAHSARSSDHNPNEWGYVMAGDLTHDPANGIDCNLLADMARLDTRTKYVIWNRKIARGGESWRPYTGANPHDKHMHVSVTEGGRDQTHPWFSPPQPKPEDDLMLKLWKIDGDPKLWAVLYVGPTPVHRYHVKTAAEADRLKRGGVVEERQTAATRDAVAELVRT